jgi:cell wall-associated NlpC family hydrolase
MQGSHLTQRARIPSGAFADTTYPSRRLSLSHRPNDQWHDEPHVAMDQLVPGDLVFFGTGDYADHVGIYVGGTAMVDAPYTGADVRIDTIPMSVGAAWGSQVVLGAVDPVVLAAA